MAGLLTVASASRYVQPLREGGSLPAVVETDEGLFVVKFRGAGQGARALVAELVCGLLARRLGLPVPELALVEVSPLFGRAEPDPEIQDLLRASHGMNVGLRYLDGAFNFDALAAGDCITPAFAADVVWFDALVTNPDRSHRNTNLLVWQRTPWLIDHGAALYVHHDWESADSARVRTAFPLIRDHVLLRTAGDLHDADARLAPLLTEQAIRNVLDAVPDALLLDPVANPGAADEDGDAAGALRDRYLRYLRERLESPRAWVAEAVRAQQAVADTPPQRRQARR